MNAEEVYGKLGELRVVPVVAIDDPDSALPLADALLEGGLPVAEITFRTEAAAAVMDTIRTKRPDVLLGAGTILTVDNLRRARDYGAAFGVAPGLNPKVVAAARKLGFPFAPGVMTPSDVEAALEADLQVLKFFPAEACGGTAMLKSLAGPYAHRGLRFIPTGGINSENFRDYLAMDVVLAVGGSWVARRSTIAEGGWEKITATCREIRQALTS